MCLSEKDRILFVATGEGSKVSEKRNVQLRLDTLKWSNREKGFRKTCPKPSDDSLGTRDLPIFVL